MRNLCLGSKAKVQERVGSFLAGLASRKEEVKRRCRTVLQSKAEALVRDSRPASPHPANAHPTLALVYKPVLGFVFRSVDARSRRDGICQSSKIREVCWWSLGGAGSSKNNQRVVTQGV